MKKLNLAALVAVVLLSVPALADPTGVTDVTSSITNGGSTPAGNQTGTTPASGTGSCDEVAQSLGACSLSDSTATSGGSGSTSGSSSTTYANDVNGMISSLRADPSCHLCKWVDMLANRVDSFTLSIYPDLANSAYDVWRAILMLTIFWTFARLLVTGKGSMTEILGQWGLAIMITAFLTQAQHGASGKFWTDIYVPLRTTLTDTATQILVKASGVTVATQISGGSELSSGVGKLFGTLENNIFLAVAYGEQLANMPAGGGVFSELIGGVLNIVAGWALILPFGAMLVLFGFYCIEAVMVYMAATCLMPVLLICLYFKPLRSSFGWMFRVYLNAGLTLIFCSLFIGFSIGVTSSIIDSLYNALQAHSAGVLFANFDYWSAVFIGCIVIGTLFTARTLASTLSQVQIGAAGAAVVGGLMSLAAKKAGAKMFGGLTKGVKNNRTATTGAVIGASLGGPVGAAVGAAAGHGIRTAADWISAYRKRSN